jgi:dienelactone hydrolase
MNLKSTLGFILLAITLVSCHEDPEKMPDTSSSYKEDNITYTADTTNMKGFVVYDQNKEGKRPGVLVVHEWWGQNDYVRNRTKQLAELGYIAMAVDMFGDGKEADNPEDAQKLATPFYQDPQMAKVRLNAALQKLRSYTQTDSTQIAAIGYCFGGAVVLNSALLGSDLRGVVSFHGNLPATPIKDSLRSKILVCHGEDDQFVPQQEINAFNKKMEAAGADYTFKSYPNSTHAFTNPEATEKGKKFNIPIAYNGAADTASWNDMKTFFNRIFTVNK